MKKKLTWGHKVALLATGGVGRLWATSACAFEVDIVLVVEQGVVATVYYCQLCEY